MSTLNINHTDVQVRKYRYIEIKPSAIRVGCAVEAQVSFVAVPIQKGRYLMLSKLRALCVLDRQAVLVSLSIFNLYQINVVSRMPMHITLQILLRLRHGRLLQE